MQSPIEVAIAKLETICAFSKQNETLTKELQSVVNILENTVKQNNKEFMDSLKPTRGQDMLLTNVKVTPEDLSKKVAEALKPQSEQALKAKASRSFE
ncbi:hypothetical protein Q876_08925 [Listeria monocytogenes]|nr:hypothetical protein [Listeria monocytogenes]